MQEHFRNEDVSTTSDSLEPNYPDLRLEDSSKCQQDNLSPLQTEDFDSKTQTDDSEVLKSDQQENEISADS